MPVRVRPSASTEPLACDGRHATPRRSKTRFDSWQGQSTVSPRVWRTHGGLRSRKSGFDSRVGDSAARLFSSSSGCDGRAHDFAKVEDQVRFLARTWPSGGGPKHARRRSLTAGRRSAKPQKRVRFPPAPLIAFPDSLPASALMGFQAAPARDASSGPSVLSSGTASPGCRSAAIGAGRSRVRASRCACRLSSWCAP